MHWHRHLRRAPTRFSGHEACITRLSSSLSPFHPRSITHAAGSQRALQRPRRWRLMPARKMPAPVRHQLLAAAAQRRHSRRLPEMRGSCSCAYCQAPWIPGSHWPPQQYANLKYGLHGVCGCPLQTTEVHCPLQATHRSKHSNEHCTSLGQPWRSGSQTVASHIETPLLMLCMGVAGSSKQSGLCWRVSGLAGLLQCSTSITEGALMEKLHMQPCFQAATCNSTRKTAKIRLTVAAHRLFGSPASLICSGAPALRQRSI